MADRSNQRTNVHLKLSPASCATGGGVVRQRVTCVRHLVLGIRPPNAFWRIDDCAVLALSDGKTRGMAIKVDAVGCVDGNRHDGSPFWSARNRPDSGTAFSAARSKYRRETANGVLR